MKVRLDVLLVSRGLAESREKAKAAPSSIIKLGRDGEVTIIRK